LNTKKRVVFIEQQVQTLGIHSGGSLFVHSSLKAIGHPARSEELIAALRSALGDEGTLLMPTFTSRKEDYFDPANTPSVLGIVTEVFRSLPGVVRSRHPRHPVAAQGPAAAELLDGHENAIGPCGRDTPFEKHARMGGQILLIGVDLDTLTLLHTAEALLDLPYLNTIEGRYLDSSGKVQKMTMWQAPGEHRGGVRAFEKKFREDGLLRNGRIGNARTLLMDAESVLETMLSLLRADPTAALCRGDYCPDCVELKGRIRARQLTELGAEISILLPQAPPEPQKFKEMLTRFGINSKFGTIDELPIVRLQAGQTAPAPPDDEHEWILQPAPQDLIALKFLPKGYAGFAYAPLEAAKAGLQPFYEVLYKGKYRDYVTDILIEDGLTDLKGTALPELGYLRQLDLPDRITLGEGNAQLREIVSAMRMRNFNGRYHLVIPPGNPFTETLKILKEFWSILP